MSFTFPLHPCAILDGFRTGGRTPYHVAIFQGVLKLCWWMMLTLRCSHHTLETAVCFSNLPLHHAATQDFCQVRDPISLHRGFMNWLQLQGVAEKAPKLPWHVAMQLIKNVCLRPGVRDHYWSSKFVRQKLRFCKRVEGHNWPVDVLFPSKAFAWKNPMIFHRPRASHPCQELKLFRDANRVMSEEENMKPWSHAKGPRS